MRPEPQAVARSTLPEARAEVSALVRTPVHGAVRSQVRGEAGTGDARSAPGDQAEALPAAGVAGQGERGEVRDEHGAQRRGEEDTAVTLSVSSNVAATVSARHAAVSVASRRASGARSDRRERRREGYPPEGSRPRSGLGRVARSRSDAPSFVVWRPAPASIFGTIITDSIGCITGCTIAV